MILFWENKLLPSRSCAHPAESVEKFSWLNFSNQISRKTSKKMSSMQNRCGETNIHIKSNFHRKCRLFDCQFYLWHLQVSPCSIHTRSTRISVWLPKSTPCLFGMLWNSLLGDSCDISFSSWSHNSSYKQRQCSLALVTISSPKCWY